MVLKLELQAAQRESCSGNMPGLVSRDHSNKSHFEVTSVY